MTTFNIGDRVRVLPIPVQTAHELWNAEGTITAVNLNGNDPDRVIVILPNHQMPGFAPDHKWYFSRASDRLELVQSFAFIPQSNAPASSPAIRQEKPCQQCRRKNDAGVSKCWWCGGQPFTGNSAV